MRRIACVAWVHVAFVTALLISPRLIRADATNADSAEHRRVAILLSDYETLPDARTLISGGDRSASILFDLYRDTQRPTFVRLRALRTLSLFPAEAAAARLISVAREPGTRPVFLREAAIGLVRCAGEGAVETLAILLHRPDPQTRRVAVEALRTIATNTARARLLAHRAQETDPTVRTVLDAALTVDQAR